MKRTLVMLSLVGVLAAGAMAQASSQAKCGCKDCPIENCPFCPDCK